jgi:hypothetical protein
MIQNSKTLSLSRLNPAGQRWSGAAKFLLSSEHPVAFIGKPNVGKTTAICALTGLRDDSEKDLNKQMGLQTGGGRTTTCEVHIRCGGEYSVLVEPFSDEELRQYVAEFCDQLLAGATGGTSDEPAEGVGKRSRGGACASQYDRLKAKAGEAGGWHLPY